MSEHLDGQPWDEAAIERFLQKMYSTTGPRARRAVIDYASPTLTDDPLEASSGHPPSDLLVQFSQRADRKYSENYAAPTVPTKASLDRVMVYQSPNISEVLDGSVGT